MNDRQPPEPDPQELEQIRTWLESVDTIDVVTPEMRELIQRKWPHLISKLPER